MQIKKENIRPLYETRFISLYDIQYAEGKHYFDATRHKPEDITAIKTQEEHKAMLPDAVSCAVVLDAPEGEYLLLTYEYRYPLGQYLLSVPAGLIDPEDAAEKEDSKNGKVTHRELALKKAAIREIREETGLDVKDSDTVKVLNPCLFSSPGMTDESNALMYIRMQVDDLGALDQSGAVGSELFDGFELVDKAAAEKILADGCDKNGIFYSVYTYMALKHFVTI